MSTIVAQFDRVSKQYRLGLTRTSIPAFLAQRIKSVISSRAHHAGQSSILWALRDVSFTLSQGESLALVGANGAGKTTLLKLLSNITAPTSGTIYKRGKLSALIELGAGFHPDLTGRENIFLNGTILGLKRSEIQRRFDEIVAFSELERFIDTPIKRYSSGMVVRLGFSVASCIQPDILLVDEVLAVGDISFQQKCLHRIHELLRQGASIIFVSHNLYLVKAVCNSALYLEKGVIKAQGSTAEVLKAYEQTLHEKKAQEFETRREAETLESASDIDILAIKVADECGGTPPAFKSTQPVEIQVFYQARKEFSAVHVSSHVYRSDGLVCFQARTFLDGVTFSLPKGRGVVKITIDPIQLTSGTYFARAAFLDERDSIAIVSGQSDWFYVEGSGLTSDGHSGVFEPKARWKLENTL